MKELPFAPYDFFGYIASGLVLVALSQVIFGFPKVIGSELKPFDIATTILGVYVAGHIISGPAKFLFEDLLLHKVLGGPTSNLLASRSPRWKRFFFPNYYKPLPPLTRAKIAAKLAPLVVQQSNVEEIFLLVRYKPEVLSSEQLIAKIDGFRDQYGFSRNLSFSLASASVCMLVTAHLRGDAHLKHLGWAALVAGVLLFYRFLKFYRQYTFELFNSFAWMKEKGEEAC